MTAPKPQLVARLCQVIDGILKALGKDTKFLIICVDENDEEMQVAGTVNPDDIPDILGTLFSKEPEERQVFHA